MSDEEHISRDDLDIEVLTGVDDKAVYVKFTGFDTEDEVEEYAENLAKVLPLLLFETTEMH